MDSIVETVTGDARAWECDLPSSPAAARNVEKLQSAAACAPHPGFEGTGSRTFSGLGLIRLLEAAH